jgi:hypothetical protein
MIHTTVTGGSYDPERRAHDLVVTAIEAYQASLQRDSSGQLSSRAIDEWRRACSDAGDLIPAGWAWGIEMPPVPPVPERHDSDPFRRCEACADARSALAKRR